MKVTIKKIKPATAIILAVIMISFFSIIYQILLKNVVVDILDIKADWVAATITSLEEKSLESMDLEEVDLSNIYIYPEDSSYTQQTIVGGGMLDNTANAKINLIDKIYTQFENYASKWYMPAKQCKIISKSFNHILGMNLIADAYGMLVFEQSDGRYMAERAYKNTKAESENIIAFSEYLDYKGINYMYVLIPSPVNPKNEKELIANGYQEYSNQMADEVLFKLSAREINTVDLRRLLNEENISWTDVFFRTDHHWNPEHGMWAAQKIAEQIDMIEGTKINLEIFDRDNYSVYSADKIYMGGYGKSATSVYMENDRMEIWYPLFDTNIDKFLPANNLRLSGTFKEVMYDMTAWPSYNVWNHGIAPVKTYHNNESSEQIKILFLTDSYSDVVLPFLACAYSDIEEIDLRCFTGSLEAYIEESKPDIVITAYSAYDFNSGSENELYNFS